MTRLNHRKLQKNQLQLQLIQEWWFSIQKSGWWVHLLLFQICFGFFQFSWSLDVLNVQNHLNSIFCWDFGKADQCVHVSLSSRIFRPLKESVFQVKLAIAVSFNPARQLSSQPFESAFQVSLESSRPTCWLIIIQAFDLDKSVFQVSLLSQCFKSIFESVLESSQPTCWLTIQSFKSAFQAGLQVGLSSQPFKLAYFKSPFQVNFKSVSSQFQVKFKSSSSQVQVKFKSS